MRSLQPLCRYLSPRTLTPRPFSTFPRHYASAFDRGPSPPRLPKAEQELFERLQQQSTGAFSQPKEDASSPSPSPSTPSTSSSTTTATTTTTFAPADVRSRINQSPQTQPEITEEGGVHPHLRRGAKPEFEGEVNPKTGEVGGPKNEPLRWGGQGDWSYNGRVTDF